MGDAGRCPSGPRRESARPRGYHGALDWMAMTSSLVQTLVLIIVVVALLMVFWRLTAARAAAMAPPRPERRPPFQRPERPTAEPPTADDPIPAAADTEVAYGAVSPGSLAAESDERAVDPSARPVPMLRADDPLAIDAINAIRSGNLDGLRQLLAEHPELATARLRYHDSVRTLLHVATDWPGHFPNGPATVVMLV